jgi:hypothetical protein
MPIRVSPITTRKRSSSKNRTAYKNMHNRAFPNNVPALNAYKKMHERAFPTSSKLSLKSYKKCITSHFQVIEEQEGLDLNHNPIWFIDI